jgi:hypothetical protein
MTLLSSKFHCTRFTLRHSCSSVLSSGMTHDQELALADQHIVQAEGHITRQLQRIEHMEAEDQNMDLAHDVLLALEHSLLVMQRFRQQLLAEPPA